jgi:hypothetical protein
VLQQEVAGVEPGSGGKALLYYHRQIDDLAERLELIAPSRFFSRSPGDIAEYLRSQGFERSLDELPEEEWFDPADGLRSVRGILEELRISPSAAPEPNRIIADLEEIERALVLAEAQGIRFHLGRELPKLGEPASN